MAPKRTEEHFNDSAAAASMDTAPDFLSDADVPGGLVAPAPKTQAVALAGTPQGFEGMSADDLLMPRIKAYHPQSKTEVEGAKIGDWYDVNEAKKLGNAIRFMLLGKKSMRYEAIDDKTKQQKLDDQGMPMWKYYTHLLVAMVDRLDVPSEIVLSVTATTPVKKLMTSLLLRSKQAGNAPTFAFVVEGKLIPTEGNLGRFAVPEFTIVGDATADQLAAAAELHTATAGSFHAGAQA